jgi:hypothetical protein
MVHDFPRRSLVAVLLLLSGAGAQTLHAVNLVHLGTKYTLRNAEAQAIRFAPDSKSLVVAGQYKGTPPRQVAVLLDRSGAMQWPSEGVADFQNSRSARSTAVAIDPNGAVITCGPCTDEFDRFAFARFTRSGESDATFNGQWTGFETAPEYKGRVVHTPSDEGFYLDQTAIPHALNIRRTEKSFRIVAAGVSGSGKDSRAVVTQMHPNGDLDETFGNGASDKTGFFASDLTNLRGAENNAAREATGVLVDGAQLLIAGNLLVGNRWQAFVIRLNENGTLDSSFNRGAGIVLLPFGADVEAKTYSMCWGGRDKDLVCVGAYSRRKGSREGWRLSAACITPDGQPHNAFSGRSIVAPSASTYSAAVANPTKGPQIGALADGSVLLVGEVTTSQGPTIGIVNVGAAVAWAAERPGSPTGLAISDDASQLIAIASNTPSGGMTVDFYSAAPAPTQARARSSSR